ncbi:zinc ribbon domain-containing protein, partial [Paenirhodobacter populi]|uniref:zinc ribbon domain-containing protein n=1 Tax=Paenirhodobacter populi TaxID=2306993 RepID=UPI0019D4D577
MASEVGLSGLVFCGGGGPYSLRGADRFAYSNHIGKGTCSNSRGIAREDLETRVLAGLKDRMMSPEIAAETMRAYAEGVVALFGAEFELSLSQLASGDDFDFGSSEGRAAIHDSDA